MSISNKKKVKNKKIPLTKKILGIIIFVFIIFFFPIMFYLTFFINRKKGFTHKTFFKQYIKELINMPKDKIKNGN